MADEQDPAGPQDAREVRQHPMFEKLMPQGFQPEAVAGGAAPLPNVRALSGYLARDPEAGYWRLYVALDLQEYYRIRDEDIANSRPLVNE